jgi:hypothetical protein
VPHYKPAWRNGFNRFSIHFETLKAYMLLPIGNCYKQLLAAEAVAGRHDTFSAEAKVAKPGSNSE